jgi:hypothetical protein
MCVKEFADGALNASWTSAHEALQVWPGVGT